MECPLKQTGQSTSQSGAGNDFQFDRGFGGTHFRQGCIQNLARDGDATAALGAATGPGTKVTQRTNSFDDGLSDRGICNGIADAYIHERRPGTYHESLL